MVKSCWVKTPRETVQSMLLVRLTLSSDKYIFLRSSAFASVVAEPFFYRTRIAPRHVVPLHICLLRCQEPSSQIDRG